MSDNFTKGEEAQIKEMAREVIPDEQVKCAAFRIFTKEKNVEKLFEGFNKIDVLVTELQESFNLMKEHKNFHKEIATEISKLKKGRWLHKGYSFVGSGIGAFVAIWIKKKIDG